MNSLSNRAHYMDLRTKLHACYDKLFEFYKSLPQGQISWFLPKNKKVPTGLLPSRGMSFESASETNFFIQNTLLFGTNEAGVPLAELYRASHRVSPEEEPFLKAIESAKASVYEIIDAKESGQVTLQDLLEERTITVYDTSLWRNDHVQGLVLGCAIMELDDITCIQCPVYMGIRDKENQVLFSHYARLKLPDGLLLLSCFIHRYGNTNTSLPQ